MKRGQEERARQEEIQIDALNQQLDAQKRTQFLNEDQLRAREDEVREKENF